MTDIGSVTLYLGWHGTYEDALTIREELSRCDIFVPESAGWTPVVQVAYEGVSLGIISPLEAAELAGPSTFQEFTIGQMELLYETKLAIEFADVPDGHEVARLTMALSNALNAMPPLFLPPAMVIGSMNDGLKSYAAFNAVREDYITGNLADIARRNPGKRILARLGSSHTTVTRSLRAQGIPVRQILTDGHFVFSSTEQASRHGGFGIPVPSYAGARLLLRNMIVQWGSFDVLLRDNAVIRSANRVMNGVLRRVTPEQVAALWTRCQMSRTPASAFLAGMAELGINFPLKLAR